MVKAEMINGSGTRITIEGTQEEVKRMLDLLEGNRTVKDRKTNKTKTSRMSISDMLHELKEEGFFDKPKSLVEVKNALAEHGRIYELSTLSAQVIRQVRQRRLGRIKNEKKWKYVTR
jgi:hypothetical protein